MHGINLLWKLMARGRRQGAGTDALSTNFYAA